MLSCINLTAQRGGRRLFEGVGFSLLPGSLLHIAGPNGCGKTTLLKVLSGLLEAEQGALTFAGEPIWGEETYLNDLCYIAHTNALRADWTVEQNLNYWMALSEEQGTTPIAAEYWGLKPYLHTPVRELSAGWQRRVALARLMLTPAHIWLLDEPTTHLDEEGRQLFWQLVLTRINRQGLVIYSSHENQTYIQPTQSLLLQDFKARSADEALAR